MIKVLCILLVICEVIYAGPPYNLFANSSDKELLLLGQKFDEFAELLEKVLSRQTPVESPEVDDVNHSEESLKGLSSSSSSGNKLSLIERIRNRLTTTGSTTASPTGSSATPATPTVTPAPTPVTPAAPVAPPAL